MGINTLKMLYELRKNKLQITIVILVLVLFETINANDFRKLQYVEELNNIKEYLQQYNGDQSKNIYFSYNENLNSANNVSHFSSVIASANIPKDHILAKIPKSLTITKNIIKESALFNEKPIRYIIEEGDFNSKAIEIYSLYYQLQRKSNVRDIWYEVMFGAWDFGDKYFPLNYTDDQLQYLQKSPLIDEIKHQKDQLRKSYNTITKVIGDFEQKYGTFEDFLKAYNQAKLRTILFNNYENGEQLILPLYDYFSSSQYSNVELIYDKIHEEFLFKANRNINEGEELFLELEANWVDLNFIKHGFQHNQDDKSLLEYFRYSIPIGFTNKNFEEQLSKIYPQLVRKDDQNNYVKYYEYLSLNFSQKVTWKALDLIRIVKIDNNRDLMYLQKIKKLSLDKILSIWNEIQVWRFIQEIGTNHLGDYETSLEHDQNILFENYKSNQQDQSSLTFVEQNCIKYRILEKKFFSELQKMSETIINFYEKFDYSQMYDMFEKDPYSKYQDYLRIQESLFDSKK